MRVKKVINNNIVVSLDHSNQELIVMGKGIGFKRKAGDEVDAAAIEKVYSITKEWNVNKLTNLLSAIPLEEIQVANDIISFAKVSLGKKLSENLFLMLSNHIHFALARHQEGIQLKNALLWEIKRFYNHEFLIGKEALSMIQSRLQISLPEDEAGFIGLHIVNAELSGSEVNQVSEMTQTIQAILNIVKYHFNMELDEYSLNFERFVTHLKFFVQRVFTDVHLDGDETAGLMFMLKDKYPKEYQCALKIGEYIQKQLGRKLDNDELIYLTIHIKRITSE
ncbi:PRD domain-containing protein [Enterococcus italicus]|uniref:BglG family transcription antiterminator LicT n=1 Tax=Enterococcus italicus TaxID=246144 RepID=UPI002073F72B|nr:PRD domain-containing protein [Enterococcus italicus]